MHKRDRFKKGLCSLRRPLMIDRTSSSIGKGGSGSAGVELLAGCCSSWPSGGGSGSGGRGYDGVASLLVLVVKEKGAGLLK